MITEGLHLGDCLDLLTRVPSGSVDMVLCDLPYGTTRNKWDSVLPLDPLWAEYRRVCRGAIVLTAAQPFTSVLVSSALPLFRHEWIWQKEPTGHLNAKKQPMREHESVLVFCAAKPPYIPQGLRPTLRKRGEGDQSKSGNYGASSGIYTQTWTGYPTSILPFGKPATQKVHPTQKPVALFEYLIRTYSEPGDLVLDNCIGSGTTAIAALNAGRRWIGMERDPEYFRAAAERIAVHQAPQALAA